MPKKSRAMTFVEPTGWIWSEQSLTCRVGSLELHGTLTLPNGERIVPGVLLISGSGPVDRNGNWPGGANNCIKLLAHGLAACEVATLRFDKRGIGLSVAAGLREQELRFDQYVTDAIYWLRTLANEPRVGRLFVAGHSEGALIGCLIAQRANLYGLIMIAGAAVRAAELIRRQTTGDAPVNLLETIDEIIDQIDQGKSVEHVPAELASIFRPTVQPYLMSWFKFDPAAELAKVRIPTLVIQGTVDLQINADDATRLSSAGMGVSLAIIEGMNHVLKQTSEDGATNLATYTNSTLPLHPALVPAMVRFIANQQGT
jgi:uncharacterized protein